MTFTHPWILLFLCLPVVLLWAVAARGAGIVAPLDHAGPRARDHRWLRWTLGVFDTAPLGIMAIAIVVLAGPQTLQKPRRERLLTNIEVCIDVSGSMSGRNYRIASEAIEAFTRAREGDAMGLTMFGTAQVKWLPLTKDLQALRNAMPFANPDNQPSHMGGTAIGAALRFCRDNMEIEATQGDRLIVLVSDGFSFDLGQGQEYEIGEELKAAGIIVYHIHVDESEAPAEMAELTRITGGESFRAADAESLKSVFAHIDRMRPARFTSVGTVPMDFFGPFGWTALALCAIHTLGLAWLRYTPW
ncbi:MAG: VWA domain-containing protein [Phycisphaerales bacterium]|nr:VWA domain-containing protein [Phycisphaerales bacterium]